MANHERAYSQTIYCELAESMFAKVKCMKQCWKTLNTMSLMCMYPFWKRNDKVSMKMVWSLSSIFLYLLLNIFEIFYSVHGDMLVCVCVCEVCCVYMC